MLQLVFLALFGFTAFNSFLAKHHPTWLIEHYLDEFVEPSAWVCFIKIWAVLFHLVA